jgi:hypothetical protein
MRFPSGVQQSACVLPGCRARGRAVSLRGVRFSLLDAGLELIQADTDNLAMSRFNHFQEVTGVAVA